MARERLESLAENDSLVYVYTRLFDFTEKIKAEQTEQAVLEGIRDAFAERGLQMPDKVLTFVPFRDTKQDQITAPNKTKVIYEEDLKRLNRCVMLVGFLDGLTKDEGICLEIGYAYGKGVPVVAVFTDFIQKEYKGVPDSTHLTDPVLLAMLSETVRNYQVAGGDTPFKKRLEDGLEATLGQLKQSVSNVLLKKATESQITREPDLDVYIDIGGGQFEWERLLQQELSSTLSQFGYKTEVSRRNLEFSTLGKHPIELGKRDIESASRARIVITCADMEEMSSGTAAIQGLARSLDKHVILLDTRTTDLVGDGGHRMSRNLMIDYSADVVARSRKDIPSLVKAFMDKRDKS